MKEDFPGSAFARWDLSLLSSRGRCTAMEGFFNTLKSSGLVDAVKDMALDALHLNDDKEGKLPLVR